MNSTPDTIYNEKQLRRRKLGRLDFSKKVELIEQLRVLASTMRRARQVNQNPGRIVSCGLNRCIAQAKGEFIVRLDVHTVYARDYIAQCLAAWQRTGADNVGGPWKAQGQADQHTPQAAVQRAVAAAFGNGNDRDRTCDREARA